MVVDRETELRGHVTALDSLAVGGARVLAVHQIDRFTFFDVSASAGLRRLGELDTRELEWVGRRGNKVVARNAAGQAMALPLISPGMFSPNWVPAADNDAMLPTISAHESWHEAVREGGFDLLRMRGNVRADEGAGRRLDRGVLQASSTTPRCGLRHLVGRGDLRLFDP